MCTGTATGHQGQGVPVCLPCHGRAALPTTAQLQPQTPAMPATPVTTPPSTPHRCREGRRTHEAQEAMWKGAQHRNAPLPPDFNRKCRKT